MAQSLEALETECKANANGDWQAYFASLRPFREALWIRAKESFDKKTASPARPDDKAPLVPLFGRPGCYYSGDQLTEVSAGHTGAYTILKDLVAGSVALPIIEAASKWIRQQGIEMIFVPGPTPPNIDPAGLVEDASLIPAHEIVSSQARAILKHLIERDVEVVDVLPSLLNARRAGESGIVLVSDTHWGPAAHRIAARMVSQHLRRLPIVQQSLARPEMYVDMATSYDAPASLAKYLTPQQQAAVTPRRKISCRMVSTMQGAPVKPAAKAPILVIGDSFTDYGAAPGTTFSAWLSRYLNQPVALLRFDGHTDHAFREMARNPEILAQVKAVVWINNQGSFASPFAAGWPKEWKIPAAARRAV